MKRYFKWFGLVGLVLALVCCKSTGPTIPTIPVETTNDTKTEKVITTTERDTVIQTRPDSTFYKAWIECRDGKPVLRHESAKPGRTLQRPEVTLDENGLLQVKVKALAEELFFKWKENHIATTTTSTKTQQIIVPVERKLSGWEITQIYLGRIFLALIALLLIAYLIKKRKSN